MERLRIGVVGGGPAGAYAAWQAAAQGHEVTLFDHRAPWEKPCGGGITVKAQDEFPWIADLVPRARSVTEFRFRSPHDHEVAFGCPRPTLIFARAEFDEAVREHAREAGARQLALKVQSVERGRSGWVLDAQGERFEVDFLVGADGAVSRMRDVLVPEFPAFVNSIAAGFFIPAELERIETKFFADARGYLWFFPRPDHLSVGLCLWGGESGAAAGRETRNRLLDLLGAYYPDLDPGQGKGYGAFIPTIMDPACWKVPRGGRDWALVGDAGGFVDAITGEGIFYALRSARAWSRALAAGRPETYDGLWRSEFGDELARASSLVHRFYHPRFIERVIGFGSRSASVRRLLSDLVMGTQSYVTLRRRLQREIVRGAARRMTRFLRPAAAIR
ncbi:MAG TPA: NAD(P)/FAD-dependent oxidoreductase [Gemmatimonadota bacterium]